MSIVLLKTLDISDELLTCFFHRSWSVLFGIVSWAGQINQWAKVGVRVGRTPKTAPSVLMCRNEKFERLVTNLDGLIPDESPAVGPNRGCMSGDLTEEGVFHGFHSTKTNDSRQEETALRALHVHLVPGLKTVLAGYSGHVKAGFQGTGTNLDNCHDESLAFFGCLPD